MAIYEVKKIGKNEKNVQTAQNTLDVIKPFLHFGLKATGMIAKTLIAIVSNIPKPNTHQIPDNKKDKIIKI